MLVPEEAISQRPAEALYDALVPVDVNPTAPNLDRVLRQQLTDGAHELALRVSLKELRQPQGAPLVNTGKAIGDLCRSLASQGLSLFIAAGDVNDRENITEGFPSYAGVWQEEQACLMDLVWYRHVKFRPWYVSWSRQIDLPNGLLLEPVFGLLLSHLCCRRQLFYACEPLSVTSGTVVNGKWLTAIYLAPSRYSNSQISRLHAEATNPGVCPVMLCCEATSNNRPEKIGDAGLRAIT